MRIALICTEMMTVPPIRGGAIQIFIDGVSPYLSNKHKLTIICISDPELPDREETNGIEYIRVPRNNYVFEVAKQLARLQATKQPFDLIHVFNRPRELLIYKAAMPEARFVVSFHNEMMRPSKISKEMGGLAVRAADKMMSISNFIGQTIITRFPYARSKVTTVYSGIDLVRYKPIGSPDAQPIREELRRKYGVEHKKVVLFVGRLSKVKGPDVLIKAMQQVIVTHPDAVLVIVGSKWFSDERIDEYGANLRKLAESLGEERVIFTNFVQPRHIPDHFLLGDIFVCSSQWEEPLARVHYEAMGAGIPVITTDRGGNAEIMQDGVNGLVIKDYTNSEAFADAITFLLSNPEKADGLAMAGRAMVERNHGFEHVAERLENLYLRAMKRRKA